MTNTSSESKISKNKNILLVLQENIDANSELGYLIEKFCGVVVQDFTAINYPSNDTIIYVCGNMLRLSCGDTILYVIKELSTNYENCINKNIRMVSLGKVPLLISNTGVYFREMFDGAAYFNAIKSEHVLQHLTESNKDSMALRTGIYLTEITKQQTEDEKELLHYRLLRCSSNFTGPTDNFRTTDHFIINTLNTAIQHSFEEETKLNHVLVQIYENKTKTPI